ncbi:MAG: flavodoxin family protein [Acidimicrobiales bacterium]
MTTILIVRHSRSGSTDRLVEAFVAGVVMAKEQIGGGPRLEVKGCFDAEPADVLGAAAIVLATPANFGYMSGAMKDFFERIFHPCLDQTVGRPFALMVKGDTDTSGAVASVERIVAGLQWKAILPHLSVIGEITDADLATASEMGATLTAGLAEGLF